MSVSSSSSSSSDSAFSEGSGRVVQRGCDHYSRNCRLIAPCCGKAYWCRHCHDEENNRTGLDPEKHHKLDRSSVAELQCGVCSTYQPVGVNCRQCGVRFGEYACLKCNLFDDDLSKKQFHCDECGMCRVGGRENFFHCQTCNCCLSIRMKDSHTCIENSMRQNCPVCCEFLHESITSVLVMNCGHTIHTECYENLKNHGCRRCPVCSKSLLDRSSEWSRLDFEVAWTPMPAEFNDTMVDIICCDCLEKSQVKFHVCGHKCPTCGGYNTTRC